PRLQATGFGLQVVVHETPRRHGRMATGFIGQAETSHTILLALAKGFYGVAIPGDPEVRL
ncbi:MAG: hypothetical protein ACRDTR_02580, partial [Rubrobacter sp.]